MQKAGRRSPGNPAVPRWSHQVHQDASALKGRDEWENHAKALSEGMAAIGWVAVSPSPAPIVESGRDASVFWANKIRRVEVQGWRREPHCVLQGAQHRVEWSPHLRQDKPQNRRLVESQRRRRSRVLWRRCPAASAAAPPKAAAAAL